ncbi:MAG: RecX family transcriptional regulator [Phycisphaerales bacterium]
MCTVIASILPHRDDPNVRRIRVGRRVVAELAAHEIESLRLAPGREWTPALAARVARVQALAQARRDALRMLARAGASSSRLRERLIRKGHDAAIAAAAVDGLARDGWVDDRAFAGSLATSLQRTGRLPKDALAARLARRGVDAKLAAEVARTAGLADGADAHAACMEAATRLLGTAQARNVDRATRARRLAAALARKGFDADSISSTLDRLRLSSAVEDDAPLDE